MPAPYSNDLRERVAALVAEGRSCREVAKLFRVSLASVVRWSQRVRDTGSAAAKPMGGVRRATLAAHRTWLLERIKEKPDLTLQALKTALAERGAAVSVWTVWKFCVSERLSVKKNRAAVRAGSSRHRAQARALEAAPENTRPQAPGVHRRDLGEDQHGPPAWPGEAGTAAA
jgi:transposase